MKDGQLDRRNFLGWGAALAAALTSKPSKSSGIASMQMKGATGPKSSEVTIVKQRFPHPLAITMWDFSWLERRWPGAGYEDWDQVLDDLKVRGYDAVRIDAYPHLVSVDPHKEWELLPCWNQQAWGSPALNRVHVQPSLNEFIAKCADRGLKVGLSTWCRQDRDNQRMKIRSPQDLGRIWRLTLDTIREAGLLEQLLYVDLNNEFPISV